MSKFSPTNSKNIVCSLSLCQIKDLNRLLLPLIAADDRIIKIEYAPNLIPHNNNARELSGINNALFLSDNILNGSGEVIAIQILDLILTMVISEEG